MLPVVSGIGKLQGMLTVGDVCHCHRLAARLGHLQCRLQLPVQVAGNTHVQVIDLQCCSFSFSWMVGV